MALITTVLITNVTNLSEARYCAGMGVQLLAFPANFVSPDLLNDIKAWIQGPKMVLDISELLEVPLNINDYQTDFILLNTTQLSEIEQASQRPLLLLLENASGNPTHLTRFKNIHYLLFENGNTVEIYRYSTLGVKILTFINTIDELEENLDRQIDGIVLRGESESKPGLKDYDHLSSILERLEISED